MGLPPGATAHFESLDGPERVGLASGLSVPSASIIKLPIMIELFRQEDLGLIPPGQIHRVTADQLVGGAGVLQGQEGRSLTTRQLVETTISYSDNVGANMLLDLVGVERVNATMAEMGFGQTRVARRLMDLEAQRRGLENMTSATDAASMLRMIHRGEMISPQASAEMLRILRLRGTITDPSLDFMGRRLSPRPLLAHINGTLSGIRNDAGIVRTERGDYILAIFLRDQRDETAAEEAIARASATVLSAFSYRP